MIRFISERDMTAGGNEMAVGLGETVETGDVIGAARNLYILKIAR